jgi:hypothetical protein
MKSVSNRRFSKEDIVSTIERQDAQARQYTYVLMALADLTAAVCEVFNKQDRPGSEQRLETARDMLRDVAAELEALGAS